MIHNKNRIVFLNLSATLILQGLTFLSAPVFSAVLGTVNYGIASIYQTWASIFSIVFTLQAASTFAVARGRFPMEDQWKYQSSVLSMAVLSYVLIAGAAFIAGLYALTGLNRTMLVCALIHGLGSYCVTALNNKFTFEFHAGRNFIFSVSLALFNIGISLIWIHQFPAAENYWGRIFGQALSYTAFGLFAYFYIFIRGRTFFSRQYWRFAFPIAFPIVFHLLSGLILGQADRLMLQHMVGNSAVGIYTLAASFSGGMGALWGAFNNSWVPFYYEYTRLGQSEEMKRHAGNYIELFSILTCGFILLSREVYHVFANESFWGGTDFIPLFAVGHYFVFLYSFPVNFEFYHRKTQLIALATMIAAGLNIVLNYFLIRGLGTQGAVLATALAHGAQFLCHFIFAKKIIREDFPFGLKIFIPGLALIAACCVLFFCMRDFWTVRWGIGALMGIYGVYKIKQRRAIF